MEGFWGDLKVYIEVAAQVFMSVSILATVIVRVTPSTSDNEKVAKIVEKVQKFLSYLPTIGINPRTKKLEEALAEIKEQK